MKSDDTDAAWAAVRAAEPDELSREELVGVLGDVRRVRSWLDSVEVRAARRVRELEAAGHAESADALLADVGGHSGRDAHSIVDREELCAEMPPVEDALAEGAITAGHVDAIAAAAARLPEAVRADFTTKADEFLRRAGQMSLDRFRRECRRIAQQLLARATASDGIDELTAQRDASNVKHWVDRQTGMHHTHLELDPVRDAKLQSAFTAELARLRAANGSKDLDWARLRVDAFVNAIAGITTAVADTTDAAVAPGALCRCGGERRGGVDRIPEITVLVDYDWLIGQAASGVCETERGEPLPIATVRRLCCDAEIVPSVLGGDGDVLDQGRSRRTASRSQRRALRAMHRGCAHPGCNVGFESCRIHHIRWWWRDLGPTDIDNLLPLCERHHHLVHEGRWTLTMTPERVATWVRPDGTLHHRGPTIDRRTAERRRTDRHETERRPTEERRTEGRAAAA